MDFINFSQLGTALIGAVLVLLLQLAYKSYQEYRGPYTGKWKTTIYDDKGEVVKIDELEMRQRGKAVFGTIRRLEPADQLHRKWHMRGRIKGLDFFAIFWPANDSVVSFGCWLVHQKNDKLFKGYYLRLEDDRHDNVVQIPLCISRDIVAEPKPANTWQRLKKRLSHWLYEATAE